MKNPPLAVAFREVRHFKPDDWLHCEELAVRGRELNWTIPAHRHEALHQLQFIERGRAEVTLDGLALRLQAPAMLLVAPGCVHAFRYQRHTAGRQVSWPSARLEQALPESLAAGLARTCALQGDALAGADGRDAERVAAQMRALHEEFEGSAPGRQEALQAHLVLLLTAFLRRAVPAPAEERRSALRDTLVQRYRALLELHLRRQMPLGFYARELRVTADHLSRACRAVTGSSALDLLHERLLLEARKLLAFSAEPVAAVAADLGFVDPSYFSRFFARRSGQSPAAYRAALRDGLAMPP